MYKGILAMERRFKEDYEHRRKAEEEAIPDVGNASCTTINIEDTDYEEEEDYTPTTKNEADDMDIE